MNVHAFSTSNIYMEFTARSDKRPVDKNVSESNLLCVVTVVYRMYGNDWSSRRATSTWFSYNAV